MAKRKNKYDEKLKIDGDFNDLFNELVPSLVKTDSIYSERLNKLEKDFFLKIQEIENSYKDYFSKKDPPLDRLNIYFYITKHSNGLRLEWTRKELLDQEIATLVDQAFQDLK